MDPGMFVGMIIRPPKNTYQDPYMDKTVTTQIGKNLYKSEGFKIVNTKGEQMSAVFSEPADEADRSSMDMPCVIYLHGNAGNLMEGMSYARQLLPLGINLCCFDCSGCGNSEGEYVTLGHKEKDDLKAVIEYLYENKRVSSIGLWGRSMGAATSIFYLQENPGTISCMVLDSGFSTLVSLVNGMAGQMGIPPEFVQMLTPMLDQ
jgi:pimeloyl-ACP methyl ester carboxylesterase